jgi:thioredoxin reductase (NADPH)
MISKPAILTVDDDPEVLSAIARDLRQRYGQNYRILRTDSAKAALETIQQLKLRNELLALTVADQRMPQMSGVELLEEQRKIFPDAKCVLLTAYADTDAAIHAINKVKLDYYLLKPWDPPVEKLYPTLDDLLDDWQVGFNPPFQGIRVIGDRWSPYTHQVKDFLARNQVPYQWLDIEQKPEALQLLSYLKSEESLKLPVILFPDGSSLVRPNNIAIAEKIGLSTQAQRPFYDLIVVGAGPAGLAAAVYGASEGLTTMAIEREAPGGQAGSSSRIENYLGFPVGLSGGDLARRAVTQAKRFGVEILTPQEVIGVKIEHPYRVVRLADGSEVNCHALLIATGVSYRQLDVPGIEKVRGAGVYYGAAMTEALSCSGETVYVVGGANSAGQAAMYFSKYAEKVVMLVRSESLAKSMSKYLIDQIDATENIEVRNYARVAAVSGETHLESITIEDMRTGSKETSPAKSLFIFIGASPRTHWLEGVVERDKQGFLLTGMDLISSGKRPRGWNKEREPYLLETSVPGIFAAGDVRYGSIKRVASGVGEGSIAVQFIHRYLSDI